MSAAEDDFATLSDDARHILEQLGGLSPAEYGQRRAAWAEELGIPVAFLDAEYKARRKNEASNEAREIFSSVEPWPEPVSGASLLQAIVRRLKRHVIFSDDAARAVALWIAFCWTHDAAIHSPILLVSSAEKDSGKTTLLGVLRFLVPRSLFIVEISAAVLYRMIEKWKPTLIVDEADSAFAQNDGLRAIINSGWTRGMGVPRCHPDTHEPEIFSTFTPKAIGMKGTDLPDTTRSRSIVIEMQRKRPDEHTDDFEHIDDDQAMTTRRLLARWAADNAESLIAAKPKMPEGFQNRLAANWRPLLAVADTVGGEWPELARKAAQALTAGETDSLGTTLLTDIREAFIPQNADRISSADLVAFLHGIEGRPWAEYGRTAKPISPNQLARLLKPFKVIPGTIRTRAGTAKGYNLSQFKDAFDRYLSPEGASETSQRHNADGTTTSATFQTVTLDADVTVEKCEKPLGHNGCDGVTDGNGGGRVEGLNGEPWPLVCEHCGIPERPGAPVQTYDVDGERFLLHSGCHGNWLAAPDPNEWSFNLDDGP
jgi:putative DNA primase/helicase